MKHRRISNLHRGLCLAGLPVRNTFASAADPLAMRYYEDAVARVNKGDTRSAPVQLRNSLQRDPTRLSAKILPGRIYLAFGQPLEAEQTLLQAQRLGADKYNNNDAFRIAGLTVNCDPRNCEPTIPQPVSPASVPAPGTLALLATGALPGRRRLRTDHS